MDNMNPDDLYAKLQGVLNAKAELDHLLTPSNKVTSAEAASIITHSFRFHGHEVTPEELVELLKEYRASNAISDFPKRRMGF